MIIVLSVIIIILLQLKFELHSIASVYNNIYKYNITFYS